MHPPHQCIDLFVDLIQLLGKQPNIALDSSHDRSSGPISLQRDCMDLPCAINFIYEFGRLLLNDGCTGMSVFSLDKHREVQFDEHKMFFIYARDVSPFLPILEAHGVSFDPDMTFVAHTEHLHRSSEDYAEEFQIFAHQIGAADFDLFDDGDNPDAHEEDDPYGFRGDGWKNPSPE